MSIPTHSLTPTSATLQFRDSAACTRWIAALPVTNVQLAQQLLAEQLTALANTDVAALERLKMLEALKESVMFAQAEMAKRYIGKPLPPDQGDAQAWNAVVNLWRAQDVNYRLCVQAYRSGDLPIAPHAALVTLRCLRTAAYALFEHYQIYREPDTASWRAFHEMFAFAEEHGLSRVRVQDVFGKRDPDTSCTDAYVMGLMANLANPYSLSVRQMVFLRRWLEKWAALINLSSMPLPQAQIPALAVDFAKDEQPKLAAELAGAPTVRYLDLEQLAKTLRQTINLLKQGQTPGQLGLAEDARQPGCENLIMLLYLQWCRAGTLRTEQRSAKVDPVEVCFGIADAHQLLGGMDTNLSTQELSARDKWEIDNLGFSMRMSTTAKQAAVKRSEMWQVLNQSASGFMCMLRDMNGVMRMTHNQLLGVRRAADNFRLGTVQWIRVAPDKQTTCGVRLFPGAPRAIKLRPASFSGVKGQEYELAFMTPAVSMPAAPAALILPAGWYQNGRLLEIQGEPNRLAKLVSLVEHGADFDRCAITFE
ncbi:MAG: hypothetical protein FJY56_08200 [Betaproteobacteria bacterium]|nr:hypothetical protein [Betaproteobacteria bacterium]